MRNLLGTLFLSAGVPMIQAGDEWGRTQHGNNNAYCHDDESTWLNWHHDSWQRDLLATTSHLIALRKDNPVLQPSAFYLGTEDRDDLRNDLAWFDLKGRPATYDWWHDPAIRVIQMMLSLPDSPDSLIVVNGDPEETTITIPDDQGPPWLLVWDSAWESPHSKEAKAARQAPPVAPGEDRTLLPHSMHLYLATDETPHIR